MPSIVTKIGVNDVREIKSNKLLILTVSINVRQTLSFPLNCLFRKRLKKSKVLQPRISDGDRVLRVFFEKNVSMFRQHRTYC